MGNASSAESVVREITRRTRKKYGTEEKIRIVLEGTAYLKRAAGVLVILGGVYYIYTAF